MTDAQQYAENLIKEMLKTQSNLIIPVLPSAKNGENVADFIKALRDGLAAEYQRLG